MEKICKYYQKGRKCLNPNKYECMQNVHGQCNSYLYYSEELVRTVNRLKWYLDEIRNEELKSLDIDWDEYETGRYSTDYSNIINLVEEALYEIPRENCRYRE